MAGTNSRCDFQRFTNNPFFQRSNRCIKSTKTTRITSQKNGSLPKYTILASTFLFIFKEVPTITCSIYKYPVSCAYERTQVFTKILLENLKKFFKVNSDKGFTLS